MFRSSRPGYRSDRPGRLFIDPTLTLSLVALSLAVAWPGSAIAAETPGLLADVRPGAASSAPRAYTRLGDRLLFVANDGVHGAELAAIDDPATPTGARLVRDIRKGPAESRPSGLVRIGGLVVLAADDGLAGNELWVTDGRWRGTHRVRDIQSGPRGSDPEQLTAARDRAFFVARQAGDLVGLWVTDGTAAGTRRVAAWDGSEGDQPEQLRALRGDLTFVFRGALWVSDGTAAGTHRVRGRDPFQGAISLASTGRLLFFSAQPADLCDLCDDHGLWRTDGTRAGTFRVGDFLGYGSDHVTVVRGQLAWFGRGGLWVSDGTRAGTRRAVALRHWSEEIEAVGSLVFFFREETNEWEQTTAIELWRSDLTAEGTRRVRRLSVPDPEGNEVGMWGLASAAGRLWFRADEPVHGLELWTSDGTRVGTHLVADLVPGPGSSGPHELSGWAGMLVLSADDGIHGAEPWSVTP